MNRAFRNPYIGPRTFSKVDRDLFFGREREARELFALANSAQLVLFYAQSGAGKSSLINTSIIPSFEKKGYELFPVARVGGDAPPGLNVNNIYALNLIRSLASNEAYTDSLTGLSITDFFAQRKSDASFSAEADSASNRQVLIVDQFEELFSTHPDAWGSREDFFNQLAQAMQEYPSIKIILVMREDHIASLDPYTHILPDGLRVRYYMQRLSRDAALRSIKKPVERLRPFAEGVAERLVDDLSSIKVLQPDGSLDIQPGQFIEPVQLQVLCYGLWENLAPDGSQITEKDVQTIGDVNQSLGKYYDRRVGQVASQMKVRERLIREWFGNKLIIAGGIRSLVLQERETRPGQLPDEVIQALQSDLVRAEKRGGVTWYELTHDRLIEPILESNRLWFEENLSPLQRQAALWNEQRRSDSWLLRGQGLSEIEMWSHEHQDEVNPTEREFLEASRRAQMMQQRDTRRRRMVTIFLLLQTIIIIVLGFIILTRANYGTVVITLVFVVSSFIVGYFLGRNTKDKI